MITPDHCSVVVTILITRVKPLAVSAVPWIRPDSRDIPRIALPSLSIPYLSFLPTSVGILAPVEPFLPRLPADVTCRNTQYYCPLL